MDGVKGRPGMAVAAEGFEYIWSRTDGCLRWNVRVDDERRGVELHLHFVISCTP